MKRINSTKKLSLAIMLGTVLGTSACGVLPFKAKIEDGHSRFVNYTENRGDVLEEVYPERERMRQCESGSV